MYCDVISRLLGTFINDHAASRWLLKKRLKMSANLFESAFVGLKIADVYALCLLGVCACVCVCSNLLIVIQKVKLVCVAF